MNKNAVKIASVGLASVVVIDILREKITSDPHVHPETHSNMPLSDGSQYQSSMTAYQSGVADTTGFNYPTED